MSGNTPATLDSTSPVELDMISSYEGSASITDETFFAPEKFYRLTQVRMFWGIDNTVTHGFEAVFSPPDNFVGYDPITYSFGSINISAEY